MLKEAIEAIVGLTKQGDAGHFDDHGLLKNRMSLWVQGGHTEWIEHDPPIRNHCVADVDSLLHLATRYKDKCSVWHFETNVCVMIDDAWRDDRVDFKLETTQAWTAALSLSEPKSQAALIDAFRTELRDVIDENFPQLIGLFQNVRFKRRDESAAEIDHGRESMGRTLEQQVTGADKLPEEITLTLRPYIAIESESDVRFALRVDYSKERFAFRPVGDDVQTAIDAAQQTIAERFRAVTDKVYYGTP